MDDEKLDQAMAELRQRLAELSPNRPFQPAGCLTFGRARALTLDPSRRTSEEERHLTECGRCARLLAGFERELPHLSHWILVRRLLDRLTPLEQQRVEYHLDLGGCRVCAKRYQQLLQSPLVLLRLPAPARPSGEEIIWAAAAEPEVMLRAEAEGLEAELVRDLGELALEVRTRRPELDHSLVAYSFADGEGDALIEGYLVLGPDVDDWFAAEVTLDEKLYQEQAGDRCRNLWIGVVDPAALSEEEWRQVSEAAPSDHTEQRSRAAWSAWSTRTLRSHPELSSSARTLLERLATSVR